MLHIDVNDGQGIFQGFAWRSSLEKKSLLDTVNALYISRNIIDKGNRIWYKLNCKTRISVITSVGESETEIVTPILNNRVIDW